MLYLAIDEHNHCLRFGQILTPKMITQLNKENLYKLEYFEYQNLPSAQIYQLIRNKLKKSNYNTPGHNDEFCHTEGPEYTAATLMLIYDIIFETLHKVGFCTRCYYVLEHNHGESSVCDNCLRKKPLRK